MVMVAHASYPDVTHDKLPASLSKHVDHRHPEKEDRLQADWSSPMISRWAECSRRRPSETLPSRRFGRKRPHAGLPQGRARVARVFESVYKLAEADRHFAKLVAKKAKRVLEFKTKVASCC